MGKNNKSGAKSAAEQAAAQAAPANKKDNIQVIQLADLDKLAQTRALSGLDPNHTVDLLKMMHETYRLDPKAAEHVGIEQDTVDKINRITAIGQVAVLANEISIAQTPFAIRMRKSQLEAIQEVAPLLGVNIDAKALPAPKDGVVELPSDAVQVSEEAKKAAKEERTAAEKKVILDPSKIENEDQLKESLLNILVKGNAGSDNFYNKVVTAINFYESYLSIEASKAEDKEDKLKALKEKSRADFLTSIAHMLGRCPFTIGGMAKFMFEQTERTKNPVTAFTQLRNASLNDKTGMPQVDDAVVADIVKVLIRWYADSQIEVANNTIAGFERDIETLKKDAKKNAKGIADGEEKIANAKKYIESIELVVSYANVPDASIADNFVDDYKDSSREGYKFARMMGSKILETYFPGMKAKEIDQECLVHNLQQYVGIIFNFFLPPMQKLVNYSEANVTEMTPAAKEEGAEKN